MRPSLGVSLWCSTPTTFAPQPAIRSSTPDSAPGPPPEARARALRRFVRLDDSRGPPGSGLGLSLVAAVARLHDVELTLDDPPSASGPGLKVTLAFPASTDKAQ